MGHYSPSLYVTGVSAMNLYHTPTSICKYIDECIRIPLYQTLYYFKENCVGHTPRVAARYLHLVTISFRDNGLKHEALFIFINTVTKKTSHTNRCSLRADGNK